MLRYICDVTFIDVPLMTNLENTQKSYVPFDVT